MPTILFSQEANEPYAVIIGNANESKTIYE